MMRPNILNNKALYDFFDKHYQFYETCLKDNAFLDKLIQLI